MSEFVEEDSCSKYPALRELFLFRDVAGTHNKDAKCKLCGEIWKKTKTNRLVGHFNECPGSGPEKVEELKS